MNTKTIAIVVGVVVVLGAGYFFFTKSPVYTDKGSQAVNPLYEKSDSGKFTGTIAGLAARGGDYQCMFDSSTAESQSTGTVYSSGGRVRGEFKTMAEGVPVDSYMIQSGGYVYIWTSAYPTGFKTKVAASDSTNPAEGTSGQYADANQSYDYDCQGWQADASLFELPAGVTFMDAGK
jgi:hypothetical protein